MAKEMTRTTADTRRREDDLRAEIEARAHALYLARAEAGQAGDELSDWLAAEAQVLKQRRPRGH